MSLSSYTKGLYEAALKEIKRLRGVINKTNIELEDEMYKVHIATTALNRIAHERCDAQFVAAEAIDKAKLNVQQQPKIKD